MPTDGIGDCPERDTYLGRPSSQEIECLVRRAVGLDRHPALGLGDFVVETNVGPCALESGTHGGPGVTVTQHVDDDNAPTVASSYLVAGITAEQVTPNDLASARAAPCRRSTCSLRFDSRQRILACRTRRHPSRLAAPGASPIPGLARRSGTAVVERTTRSSRTLRLWPELMHGRYGPLLGDSKYALQVRGDLAPRIRRGEQALDDSPNVAHAWPLAVPACSLSGLGCGKHKPRRLQSPPAGGPLTASVRIPTRGAVVRQNHSNTTPATFPPPVRDRFMRATPPDLIVRTTTDHAAADTTDLSLWRVVASPYPVSKQARREGLLLVERPWG